MKKVILLALMMPCLASGQNTEYPGFRGDFSLIVETRAGSEVKGPKPGDVVITEIMADPSPVVSLPAKEYIEIHNRSLIPYNLKGWMLSDGNGRCYFPETIIPPGDYFIVCQIQDTNLFRSYGKTMGVKSFPALTDAGKLLYITDQERNLVHGVEYSPEWYGDVMKDGGGWSLEMIDENYPFFQEGNWKASVSDAGGTPGRKNSVSRPNPDELFTGFANVFPIDDHTLSIRFQESVSIPAECKECLTIEGNSVDSVFASDPLLRAYTVILAAPLKTGEIYIMSAGTEVTDFAGNPMQQDEFGFGIPEEVRPGDVSFNELLFNPFPGEPDYIEFYNRSPRIVNAPALLLVSVSSLTGDTSSVVRVSEEDRCMIPGSYYVITTDRESVISRFPSSIPENIFRVKSLPSMPDDKGHLILFSRSLVKIDEVSYSGNMHFPLLAAEEGVALEKVMTNAPSEDIDQWHSASEASGWGTPGAPNSVMAEFSEAKDVVAFSSARITPDNDGYEDLLVINLKLEGIGNVISVTIFDETGSFVKKLTDNMLAGQGASIVWDGTAADERLVDTGIYVFLITLFDDHGKTRSWKKVCTVIRR
jgi:hypothetical protein